MPQSANRELKAEEVSTLPRVTHLLAGAGLVDFSGPWFTEASRAKGEELHAWCHLVDTGAIDWDGTPADILPEVQAYAAWKEAAGFQVIESEQRIISNRRRFTGQPDAVGRLGQGRGQLSIIDRKRGAAARWMGVQLAGYAVLLAEREGTHERLIRRYAIAGLGQGKARVIEFTDPRDFDAFYGALAVSHWKGLHV